MTLRLVDPARLTLRELQRLFRDGFDGPDVAYWITIRAMQAQEVRH